MYVLQHNVITIYLIVINTSIYQKNIYATVQHCIIIIYYAVNFSVISSLLQYDVLSFIRVRVSYVVYTTIILVVM